ncbi:MAG: helix-hairpin-helix domain-containing protein [bacterium]|nr:helix-hairpin-helix domain-containing protein [bacterium]
MEKLIEWFGYHQRKIWILGGIMLFSILILGCGVFYYLQLDHEQHVDDGSYNLEELAINMEKDGEVVQDEEETVKVDIKGAVHSPGVVEVSIHSRVMDVIVAAGGVLDYADVSVLNLSKRVFDEMVIIVYTKDEVRNFVKVKEEEQVKQESCVIVEEKIVNHACICENIDDELANTTDQGKDSGSPNSIISLNNATLEELMTLPGIGESKAQAIISYRDSKGNFQTIEELKEVKGIGDSLFEDIKDRITV